LYSKLLIKNIYKFSGSNKISNHWQSGGHIEILSGINVDDIFVRNIKLYEEYKNVLCQLKVEDSKIKFLLKYIISKTKNNSNISYFPTKTQCFN